MSSTPPQRDRRRRRIAISGILTIVVVALVATVLTVLIDSGSAQPGVAAPVTDTSTATAFPAPAQPATGTTAPAPVAVAAPASAAPVLAAPRVAPVKAAAVKPAIAKPAAPARKLGATQHAVPVHGHRVAERPDVPQVSLRHDAHPGAPVKIDLPKLGKRFQEIRGALRHLPAPSHDHPHPPVCDPHLHVAAPHGGHTHTLSACPLPAHG